MLALTLAVALSATAPDGPADERPSLVVLALRAVAADAERASFLDELLLQQIERVGRFKVLGMSDLKALIGFDKARQVAGCDEASCAAEIGGALGVRYIVAGIVSCIEGNTVLAVKMLDTRSASVLDRATVQGVDNPRTYEQLVARAVAELEPLVQARPGTVSVRSKPEGAAVSVDGAPAGVAPIKLTLAAGRHALTASLARHHDATSTIAVSEATTIDTELALEPERAAVLVVETEPAGAGISIAGDLKGQTTAGGPLRIEVAHGSYELDAALAGYVAQSRSVSLAEGESLSVTLQLARKVPPYRGYAAAIAAGGAVSLGFGVYALVQAKAAGDDFRRGDYSAAGRSKRWEALMYAGGVVGAALATASVVVFRKAGATVVVAPAANGRGVALAGGF
jgi:TolB-like protein